MNTFADGLTSFLLILDNETSHILNSYMTMTELINLELFSVELITKKRQPYKAMNAIYFLTPSSCELLEKDFIAEDGKAFNLYKKAHLFFSEKLTDYEINKLVKQEIVPRIGTLKEANAGFLLADKNVFYLNVHSYYLDQVENQSLLSYLYLSQSNAMDAQIRTFCEKIASACIIANQLPSIAFFTGDRICKKIASQVSKELADYYKGNDKDPNKNSLMLITSRLVDLCGPLLYDLSYSTLLYDNLKKKDTNTVIFQGKNYTLDDRDILYSKYKNTDIGEVLSKVPNEFDEFTAKANKLQKNHMDTFEEMGTVIRDLTDIQRTKSQFIEHINLLSEIKDKIKEISIMEILDIQNNIISGINESGTRLKYKDIIKDMRKLSNKIDKEGVVRLLCLLNYYLNLSPDDLQSALENANDYFDGITKNDEKVIAYFTKENSISKDEIDSLDKEILIYRTKNKDSKKLEKDNRFLCVKEAKLATLVEMLANNVLPIAHFDYLQEPKNKGKKKKKKIGLLEEANREESDEAPKDFLFLFNFGGISHYEVSSIEKVGKEIGYQVAIGSNDIFNANEYLKLAGSHVSNKGKVINIPRENAKNANSSIASDVRIIANSKGAETQLIDKSE